MHLPRQATGIFFYSMLPQLATRQCWILLLLYASLNSGWQFACAVWFLFSINSVKYEIAVCWQDCFTEEIADDWLQWCSEVGVHTKLTPKWLFSFPVTFPTKTGTHHKKEVLDTLLSGARLFTAWMKCACPGRSAKLKLWQYDLLQVTGFLTVCEAGKEPAGRSSGY